MSESEKSANIPAPKKVIFSGIQPTGEMTLGNYLGAVKNWVELQDEYRCVYSVVNLHALTVRQDAKELRENTLRAFALLLACGIDPEKSVLFVQGDVAEHSELTWLLSCYTQFGELSRMTQFKDKSAKNPDNVNAGLFTYPVLMAADILLYQTQLVPVGADQKQHLEIARDIAIRFNNHHGDVFTLPEPYIPKIGARIMSLSDPSKKMSKSDDNPNAFISLLDEPDRIIKKFKRAVTDSQSLIAYGEGRDGINNLISIYSAVAGKSFPDIEAEFEGKGYGDFKTAVGIAVADYLKPVRDNFALYMSDKAQLEALRQAGAANARALARRTLDKASRKLGLR